MLGAHAGTKTTVLAVIVLARLWTILSCELANLAENVLL